MHKGLLSQSLDPCPARELKESQTKTVKERWIVTMVTIMEQFVFLRNQSRVLQQHMAREM